ncbi:MAG: glycosyltransferase family 4 protein [Candidatus Omnitrophica bacterium]|nr:glycosyltransferase family 4 protein [Candidatus Omnitrophota bacterium]MDD5429309.1 glycosyltransferase family 4 protein [Candidatus Omnitrophota bacterium]
MKVLVFGHMYTEPIHREKFRYICDSGDFEIRVVVPHLWRHTLCNYEFKPAQDAEEFQIIPCRISFSGDYFRFYYRNVSRIIKEYKPDIIEIDQEPVSKACIDIISKAKKIVPLSKIVVWTSEDTIKKRRFPFSRYERYNLSKIDHIIACNLSVEKLLRKKGYKGKISVFQFLGTSPDIFKKFNVEYLREKLGLANQFVVGYVGRLSEGKGLFTLAKAFSFLNTNYRLLIVGKGELQDKLMSLARNLSIEKKIIFTGAVKHEEVAKYINCMNVLILPSEGTKDWQEKFGYVIPQAMLCEVPVIGSRHGGIPEVIADAGRMFEPGNVQDLVRGISRMKNDVNLRKRYIQEGKQRALNNYTVKIVAQKIMNIYRRLFD